MTGAGTTFTIKIPLTLAIVSALIVEAAGERFAIPQLSVLELVRADTTGEHRIERIKDTPVLRLRNKLLPLINLTEILQLGDRSRPRLRRRDPGRQPGVRHRRRQRIAYRGNRDQADVLQAAPHRGILGDDDPRRRHGDHDHRSERGRAGARPRHAGRAGQARSTRASDAESEDTDSLLVFRAGSQQPKAVPLSLVSRLEEIDCRRIEVSDGRYLVQYRDQLMPLLRIDTGPTVRPEGAQPILVFSDHGRSMGLVVDEIVDIVEERLDIEVASERPGVLGYAVVKGTATEIVDIGHFLPQAFADWFRRRDARRWRRRRRSCWSTTPRSSATCFRR